MINNEKRTPQLDLFEDRSRSFTAIYERFVSPLNRHGGRRGSSGLRGAEQREDESGVAREKTAGGLARRLHVPILPEVLPPMPLCVGGVLKSSSLSPFGLDIPSEIGTFR